MTSTERFWNARWEEYKALDPNLTEADRPAWLKPSITPAEFERQRAQKEADRFERSFWAL